MNYQFYDVARLHGRDLIFATGYWKEKIFSGLSSQQAKSLILCNSYPKSGTHLLYQILYSIPGLRKWDDIVSVQALCGVMNTSSHIRWKIGTAPNNSIVRCHLMHCDEIHNILKEFSCKTIFIYRDLRDVVVSHARWVTKEERIFLHNIYLNQKNFDQQLMSSIKGVPIGSPFGSNISQPDIGQDFNRWKGWIYDKDTLAVKFEDLVGERGGGCEKTRLHTIQRIFDYLNVNLSYEEIKSRFASCSLNPQESHTFMKGGKGSIGGWKSIFKEFHKDAFKKVAGDLLIELDYETDLNW